MAPRDFYVCGSTHIDLAWKKTTDEMAELFESFVVRLLDLLETDPEFVYVIEQAAHFRRLEQTRPDLVDRIRRYLKSGRLEMMGGMVSTAKLNGPCGESLIRNQLLGMRWTKEHLGAEPRTAWLIDTFGLPAQLPQILRQFGFTRLMANRFGGTVRQPVFVAQGLDGSELLIVGRDVHSPFVEPDRIFFRFVRDWRGIDDLFELAHNSASPGEPHLVMPYTENEVLPTPCSRWMMSSAGQDDRWRYELPSNYLDELERSMEQFPRLFADLNPEFTATFSQRMEIRLAHRRVESFLLEAEKWNALIGSLDFASQIEDAWWRLAFVQFHDVYTGSHPTAVLKEVRRELEAAEQTADLALEGAIRSDLPSGSPRLVVLNGLPSARTDWMEIPDGRLDPKLVPVNREGEELPTYRDGNGHRHVLVSVVGAGRTTFELRPGEPADWYADNESPSESLENEHVRLEYSIESGLSLIWKPSRTPIMQASPDLITVQHDEGSFQIEDPRPDELGTSFGATRIRKERLGMMERIVVSGRMRRLPWAREAAPLDWEATLSLAPQSDRVDMDLTVKWSGERSRVRLKLVTDLEASRAWYEVPFGAVLRRPYRDRGTARGEWPAQRFVAIQDGQLGLAVINTGAHGTETSGGVIWTSLLRAPAKEYAGMVPDLTSSQHGVHRYRFGLVPFTGSWQGARVMQHAAELNTPLVGSVADTAEFERSWFSLSPEGLILSTIKNTADGSGEIVVRVYESAGRRTTGRLWVDCCDRAWRSDLREGRGKEIPCRDGQIELELKPHEILTVRISREPA